MACTRENPCGAVLYSDAQNLELALAGIPRRVRKCLAGHAYWEGGLPARLPSPAGADVSDDPVADIDELCEDAAAEELVA